ncbi:MAG: vWA domain-containing protein [Endomicrobiia bacterium]
MIKFYNQYLLFFLPLSLLPVILHLLFSKKTVRVKFTYTNLIEKILNQNFYKKKIIDVIILILRCLIIFLLIIYFARPVMYFNPKQEDFDLIIAVDTSCSVRQKVLNTTKFEILKEKVKELLKFLKNKNVKIKLLLFDEEIKVLNETFEFSSDELIEKINNIKPSYKSTNIKLLFNYIYSFLDSGIKRNYYKMIIFTDFAEHIFKDSFIIYDTNKIKEILFCYPEVVSTNIGIESLYLEDKNDETVINCLSFVFGKEIKNFNAKLFVGFKYVDVVNVDAENKRFVFNYPANEKNFFGKILLPNDGLIEDNEFYFVNNISNSEEVICFIKEKEYYAGFKSKKFYFEKLYIPKVSFKIVSSEEKINFKNKNLIIVDEEKINDLLNDFSFGNKLVIFPNEKIDYENYEEFLKEIEIIELQKDNLNPFKIILAENSEFNEYFNKFNYEKIWVKSKFLVNVNKKSDWITLLKFNDGTPALVKKNNIFLFTFPIHQSNTNLLYKPIFLGLLKFIFLEKQQDINRNYYFVSEKISLADDKIVKINNFITTDNIEDLYIYEDNNIIFYIPGIYELVYENKNKLYVAVNIKSDEGKVSLLEKNKIKDQFKNINVSFLNTQKTSFGKELYDWCVGKEYSQNVMYLIILLFTVETLLSRVFYKKLI